MLKIRAQLLAFAFRSERERWIGLTQKRWTQIILILIFVAGFRSQLWWLLIASVALILIVALFYRWARRTGYTTFIPAPSPQDAWHGEPLSSENKIPVRASGRFLLGETERPFILAAGKCWFLPIGEVALMIDAIADRFAYQFINPKTIEHLRFGHLWFGHTHEVAIEVIFQTDWIQADDSIEMGWQQKDDDNVKKLGRRTIVLSFDHLEAALQVWDKLAIKPNV